MVTWNSSWLDIKSYDINQTGTDGIGGGSDTYLLDNNVGVGIRRNIGMQFSVEDILQGWVVSDATLTLNLDATSLPTGNSSIKMVLSAKPSDDGDVLSLPGTIEDYINLPKTSGTEFTLYGEDENTAFDVDLTAQIQALVDAVTWFDGISIAVFVEVVASSSTPHTFSVSSIVPSSLSVTAEPPVGLRNSFWMGCAYGLCLVCSGISFYTLVRLFV
jgi:hypothetical protein